MIDLKAVGSADGKRPVRHFVESWKLRHENHRRFTDGEKQPRGSSIGNAPARLSRQIERILLAVVEIKGAKLRAVYVIPNTGRNRQLQPRHDGNAVWSRAGVEYPLRSKALG